MTFPEHDRTRVFISYSHKDAEWLELLRRHLKALELDYAIDIWDDTKIRPSSKWQQEIKNALQSAKVAVLLISADFLASEFIRNNELPPLLDAANKEGVIILPVIVSPCRFAHTRSLSMFQAVNSPSNTLIEMTRGEQEKLFVKVTEEIEAALSQTLPEPIIHDFDTGKLRNHLKWRGSPEGVLQAINDRLEDAHRDLRRTRDSEQQARIEDEIALLEKQISKQQRIMDGAPKKKVGPETKHNGQPDEKMSAQEIAVKQSLESWKYDKYTFTQIKRKFGGFEDDELRKILVGAGAERFKRRKDGAEMWGLTSRNQPRSRPQAASTQ